MEPRRALRGSLVNRSEVVSRQARDLELAETAAAPVDRVSSVIILRVK
jgi:hypothetical protein